MGTAYMKMVYIDNNGDARQTGVGAAMETDVETREAFESYRKHHVAFAKGRFLLDLYGDHHDLQDTLCITAETFEAISGEKAKTDAEYVRFDEEYWEKTNKEPA